MKYLSNDKHHDPDKRIDAAPAYNLNNIPPKELQRNFPILTAHWPGLIQEVS